MSKASAFVVSFILVICCSALGARAAQYHRNGAVIGEPASYRTGEDDSLFELAHRFDLGIDAICDANPDADPFVPGESEEIVIPSQWILPDVPLRRGIVINIAEMRLYYYAKDRAREVTTFPVGIGDEGMDTPLGTFTIIEKIKNPAWYVPKSIREEKPELPAVVPPGPDNPMGSRALRLSRPTVLIHGTDRPWGIGSRNSHGCIRLFERDIALLFDMVPLRTRVTIVNQPVKVAVTKEHIFLQVSEYEDDADLFGAALELLAKKKLTGKVDLDKVEKATEEHTGLLVDIAKEPSPPPAPEPPPFLDEGNRGTPFLRVISVPRPESSPS